MLCIEVLEHLKNDWKAVSEIHQALKTGGAGVFAFPLKAFFPKLILRSGHVSQTHKRECYDFNRMTQKLRGQGFNIKGTSFNLFLPSQFGLIILHFCTRFLKIRPPSFIHLVISFFDLIIKLQPYDAVVKVKKG